MSTIPEGDICTNLSLYEEYRDKYPEIPADDLRKILEKVIGNSFETISCHLLQLLCVFKEVFSSDILMKL